MSVYALQVAGRLSIPEFGNLQRLEFVLIGKLEQARGGTFTRATGRKAAFGIGKDIDDVAIGAQWVEEIEMREDFTLQGDAQFLATCHQLLLFGRVQLIGRGKLVVDFRDLPIFLQIEIVGILQVIDGWYKVAIWIVQAIDHTTIGHQIVYIIIGMHA